ncbi:MAG: sulfurtransferase [Chloroflexi bacterium]|nr:sulfurtransferase [Chloroflexota bacterium]
MAGYAKPEVLVSTQWVADHLHDPTIRLVEVDVDTTAYETGHVAGAIDWSWKRDLSEQVRRDIAMEENWEKLLGESGIGNDTFVILYGDNNNWFAAFAYWVVRYYGHQRAALMNGGRKKWLAEQRPLTTEAPRVTAAQYRAAEPSRDIRALRDQVAQSLDRANIALVDVRSPAEYRGELLAPENLPQEGAQRGGHLPGAANIPWATAVNEDGTFRAADELRQIYGGKGITPDKEIIAYCRIGERSAHTWFVLHELLGYASVRNYDGSWTEWGSLVGAPIER